MESSLSIVIPAYKQAYLCETLDSFAAQTNQEFRLFIGDDNSPFDLRSEVDRYKSKLDIVYVRFEANLGQTNLISHWDRCVKLTSSPWVWLFSDDDIASPRCVEMFYKALEKTQGRFDLYRFNTSIIDAKSIELQKNPSHPQVETALDFLKSGIECKRYSYAVEYVFSRSQFDQVSGFVNFPLAWCSDDASWLAMSSKTGICLINESEVKWRLSQHNISCKSHSSVFRKFEAIRLFVKWAKAYNSSFYDFMISSEGNRALLRWIIHSMGAAGSSYDLASISWLVRHFWREIFRDPIFAFRNLTKYALRARKDL